MAGSYRHVTNSDGTFSGLDTIENLGDANEAIEEMHDMIEWLANRVAELDHGLDTPRTAIHEAWRTGHMRKRLGDIGNELLWTYKRFWESD